MLNHVNVWQINRIKATCQKDVKPGQTGATYTAGAQPEVDVSLSVVYRFYVFHIGLSDASLDYQRYRVQIPAGWIFAIEVVHIQCF